MDYLSIYNPNCVNTITSENVIHLEPICTWDIMILTVTGISLIENYVILIVCQYEHTKTENMDISNISSIQS